MSADVGIVVIGRNEGERLARCLASLRGRAGASPVVYVDSGSTDGSARRARALGVTVVELDARLPDAAFTAARGRNAGFAALARTHPGLKAVQFLDGDTVIHPAWLALALRVLAKRPDVAAVCGRRRERARDHSPFNAMCDLEWDTAVGEATGFGGDVMVRASCFAEAGGYNEALIAGEDPELAMRIRKRGWNILRIDADMTLHDAAMNDFRAFWTRAVRGGTLLPRSRRSTRMCTSGSERL